MPGYTAELSLYESRVYYRTTGAVVPAEGQIFPALSRNSFEALMPCAFVDSGEICDGSTGGGYLSDYSDSFKINMWWAVLASSESKTLPVAGLQGIMNRSRNIWVDPKSHVITRSDTLVTPASVPGHTDDLSGQCDDCTNGCVETWGAACTSAAALACLPSAWIPFVGPAIFAACVVAGDAFCYGQGSSCIDNCHNIGSPCCPVACGSSCCNYSETCLDTAQGLCCSAGTLPCPGPQESCYDPNTEKCQPSGVGCPYGQECGNNCCDQYSQCVDPNTGNCCPLLTGIPCGNQCCDGLTQRCTDTGCCPTAQACNGVCCPPGFICNANNQCVVAPTCQPGESLCVSFDKTKQNCCPGNTECCPFDGSCCDVSQGKVCCGARGCIYQGYCYG